MERMALLCAAATVATSALGQVEIIDQRHDLREAFEAFHNIAFHEPVAQEFVPTLGALDFVELWTLDIGQAENGLGASLRVLIREDGPGGAVVAESVAIDLPDGYDGVARFALRERVRLSAGRVYAIEIDHVDGDAWGVRSYGELYPKYDYGRYFLSGNPSLSMDMWFRTGVEEGSVSLRYELPGTLRWEGVPPLVYTLWASSDLVEWSRLSDVSSEAADYLFVPPAMEGVQRFYVVSLAPQSSSPPSL